MIPLRIPEQVLVKSVADGAAIALLLKQTSDEHECQWGLTIEQADRLIEMLQQARNIGPRAKPTGDPLNLALI